MPGFIGHTTANGIVLLGTTAVMRWQGWSWSDVVAVDAGITIASIVLSPDMDLFNSKPMDGWGWLRLLWWPYSKLAKHRDRLHMPVVGTAVRWAYWSAILALLITISYLLFRRIGVNVDLSFEGGVNELAYNLLYLFDVFLGAVLADTTHYVLDMTTTRLKRLVPVRFRERYDRYAQNHWDREHRYPNNNPLYPGVNRR